jgi:hypothetical protein
VCVRKPRVNDACTSPAPAVDTPAAALTPSFAGAVGARLRPGRRIVTATLVVAGADAAFFTVGLTYGAGIWLFMNAVLPLGHSTRENFFSAYYLAFLLDHAVLVGLPIALIMLRALRAQVPTTPSRRATLRANR